MFINQIGMVSLQESVYHGVQVLGLPLSYEQKLNAHVVNKKVIGQYTSTVLCRYKGQSVLNGVRIQSKIIIITNWSFCDDKFVCT